MKRIPYHTLRKYHFHKILKKYITFVRNIKKQTNEYAMKKDKSTFASNLIYLRKTKRLSQELLAKEISSLSKVNYTKNIIASYETDRTAPKNDFIRNIEILFNMQKKYDIVKEDLSTCIKDDNLSCFIHLDFEKEETNEDYNIEEIFTNNSTIESSKNIGTYKIQYLKFENLRLKAKINELEEEIKLYSKQLELKNNHTKRIEIYLKSLQSIVSNILEK